MNFGNNSRYKKKAYLSGFTLIELLIVLTIIGVLVSLVMPVYHKQMMTSRRSDGQAMLMQIQSNMERFIFDHATYPVNLALIPVYSSNAVSSNEGHYLVSVLSATSNCPIISCYVLQAVPQGGQAGDGNLELKSNGTRIGNW